MIHVPLDCDAPQNPKVVLLSRRLGMPIPHVLGYLACLWCRASVCSPNGHLDMPDAYIECMACWDGAPGEFVAAAIAEGLLDRVQDGLEIHGFFDRMRLMKAAQVSEGARIRKREQRAREDTAAKTAMSQDVTGCHAESQKSQPPQNQSQSQNPVIMKGCGGRPELALGVPPAALGSAPSGRTGGYYDTLIAARWTWWSFELEDLLQGVWAAHHAVFNDMGAPAVPPRHSAKPGQDLRRRLSEVVVDQFSGDLVKAREVLTKCVTAHRSHPWLIQQKKVSFSEMVSVRWLPELIAKAMEPPWAGCEFGPPPDELWNHPLATERIRKTACEAAISTYQGTVLGWRDAFDWALRFWIEHDEMNRKQEESNADANSSS